MNEDQGPKDMRAPYWHEMDDEQKLTEMKKNWPWILSRLRTLEEACRSLGVHRHGEKGELTVPFNSPYPFP